MGKHGWICTWWPSYAQKPSVGLFSFFMQKCVPLDEQTELLVNFFLVFGTNQPWAIVIIASPTKFALPFHSPSVVTLFYLWEMYFWRCFLMPDQLLLSASYLARLSPKSSFGKSELGWCLCLTNFGFLLWQLFLPWFSFHPTRVLQFCNDHTNRRTEYVFPVRHISSHLWVVKSNFRIAFHGCKY